MITPYSNAVYRRSFELAELHWAEQQIAAWDATVCDKIIREPDARINIILHLALGQHRIDIVSSLFEASDIAFRTHKAFSRGDGTHLHVALYENFPAAVQLLCQDCNLVEVRDYRGYTPLMFAADMTDVSLESIKALLEAGADVSAEFDGSTALLLAAQQDSKLEIVKLLLEAGSKLEQQDLMGRTALFRAAEHGCSSLLKLLLEAGAAIDQQNAQGKTALCRAAEYGYVDIVKLLIESGADVNKRDADGCPLLFRCVGYGNAATIKALIEAGASVTDRIIYIPHYSLDPGIEGFTVAHLAAKSCREETLRDLKEAGACMNARTKCGQTPLHYACSRSAISNMAFLIEECGADVNASDVAGQTPLSSIVKWDKDFISASMLLLEHSARPDADTMLQTFYKCYPDKGWDVLPVVDCMLRVAPQAGTQDGCKGGLTVLETIIQKERYERGMWKFGGKTVLSEVIVMFLVHGSRCWDAVPVPCAGVGRLFAVVPEEEWHQLFMRLYPSVQDAVRLTLLCMNNVNLPKPVERSILTFLVAES